MARPPRNFFSGGIYHIITRAVEGRGIFSLEESRLRLLSDIDVVQARTHFILHAYCVMGNHLHLLIQQGPVSLSKVMQGILTRFAVWYNNSSERTGHVFQRRYSAFSCANERYLLATARYIHRNPVKAGMVASPVDWAWSSHLDYLGLRSSSRVSTSLLLSILHPDQARARRTFKRFVEGGKDGPMPIPEEPAPTKPPLFADKPARIYSLRPLGDILDGVCFATGIVPAAILGPSRARPVAFARAQFAAAALESGYPPKDLLLMLGRSWAWISKVRAAKSAVSGGLTP